MTRGFLGIDVGGTATRWAIVGEDDVSIARGVAAGATGHLFNDVERERFTRTLSEIRAATSQPVTAAHMGVTGLGATATVDAHRLVGALFGIDPGAELQRLELAILRRDPGLAVATPGSDSWERVS